MPKKAIFLTKDDPRIEALAKAVIEEQRRLKERVKFAEKQIVDVAKQHFDNIEKIEDQLHAILIEKGLVTKEQTQNDCIHIELGAIIHCTDHAARPRDGAYRVQLDIGFKRGSPK